jgi:hypothetical protein
MNWPFWATLPPCVPEAAARRREDRPVCPHRSRPRQRAGPRRAHGSPTAGGQHHRLIQGQTTEEIAEEQAETERPDDLPRPLAIGLDPTPEGDGGPGLRVLEQEEIGARIGAVLEPPVGALRVRLDGLDGAPLDHADDEIGVAQRPGVGRKALHHLGRQQRMVGRGHQERERQMVEGGEHREARRRRGRQRLDPEVGHGSRLGDADRDPADPGTRPQRLDDPLEHRLAADRQHGLQPNAGGHRHRVALWALTRQHQNRERRCDDLGGLTLRERHLKAPSRRPGRSCKARRPRPR